MLPPEQEKTRLAEEITKDVMDVLHYGEESVSVAIEEIRPQDWAEKVYTPEILHRSVRTGDVRHPDVDLVRRGR